MNYLRMRREKLAEIEQGLHAAMTVVVAIGMTFAAFLFCVAVTGEWPEVFDGSMVVVLLTIGVLVSMGLTFLVSGALWDNVRRVLFLLLEIEQSDPEEPISEIAGVMHWNQTLHKTWWVPRVVVITSVLYVGSCMVFVGVLDISWSLDILRNIGVTCLMTALAILCAEVVFLDKYSWEVMDMVCEHNMRIISRLAATHEHATDDAHD